MKKLGHGKLVGFWCLFCGKEFKHRKDAKKEDIIPKVLNGGLKVFIGQYSCYECNTLKMGSRLENHVVNEPFYKEILKPVLDYYKGEGSSSSLPSIEHYRNGTRPSFSPIISRVLGKIILGTAASMMPAWVFMEEEQRFNDLRGYILNGEPDMLSNGNGLYPVVYPTVRSQADGAWKPEAAHYIFVKEFPPNAIVIQVKLCGFYGLMAPFKAHFSPSYLNDKKRYDYMRIRFDLISKKGHFWIYDQDKKLIEDIEERNEVDLPVRIPKKFLELHYEKILNRDFGPKMGKKSDSWNKKKSFTDKTNRRGVNGF